MTNANGLPPAGWFPDPHGSGRLRYWNGAAWTDQYHPPFAPPAAGTVPFAGSAPAAVAAPKRRRGLLIGLIAGGTALALLIVAAVVVIPRLVGGGNPFATLHTDVSDVYDYTDAILGIEPDHEFEIPADYDLDALTRDHAAEVGDTDEYTTAEFAFGVFYDPALTRRADVNVFQYEPGDPVEISNSESSTAFGSGEFSEVEIRGGDGFGWGVHDEYFLVQYLDRSGETLAKPIVTRFTAARKLDTPDVSFSEPEGDGNITLSWAPIEGADDYLIVISSVFGVDENGEGGSRSLTVVGRTSDSEWSSATTAYEADVAPFALTQNDAMTLFTGSSADSLSGGIVYSSNTTSFDIGVIATNGTDFSPYATHDANDVLAALPYETAFYAMRAVTVWGPSGYLEGIESVPTRLYFTSLDGSTRSTVGYIERSEVVDYGNRWVLPLRGRGTMLGDWMPVLKSTIPDLDAAIAQFNAAAAASAPTTGMPTFAIESAPVDELAAGDASTPDVDYPLYGSSELSLFLAAHLIVHTPVIDVSAYVNEPGAPDAYDAVYEAMGQNPYVLGVDAVSLSSDGTKLYIGYGSTLDADETRRETIRSAVDAVVDRVVTDGMTDAAKASALDRWLIDNAAYDYTALAAKDELGDVPEPYEYAWDASGVLTRGLGVCASYAAAFALLGREAGLDVVVVTGDVLAGGRHAWNKVSIDGVWRAVDVTWNDASTPDRYLLISDAQFTDSAARIEDSYWMIDSSLATFVAP